MIEVRFHGRGGQGAKIASRILGSSGFLAGLHAQDFALFGAERRGAPVVSFTRLDGQAIAIRGYIETPSAIVVMDRSLLKEAREQIFQGVDPSTPVFINGTAEALSALAAKTTGKIILIDLTSVCRRVLGQPLISAAAAAVAAKCIQAISLETLIEAVRLEFTELGVGEALIARNQAAAREIYGAVPKTVLPSRPIEAIRPTSSLEVRPRAGASQFIGSAIHAGANAALRHTGGWRAERPEIERARCRRCFLCYLYCAEAAIHLDQDNYPHVDYDHCKGCLVCRAECPAGAIWPEAEI